MNEESAKCVAASYLRARKVEFVNEGSECIRIKEGLLVSFPVPETLIPGAVVDPPDVKVLVKSNEQAELWQQM